MLHRFLFLASLLVPSRVLHSWRSDASSRRRLHFNQFDLTMIHQAALIGRVMLRQSRPPVVRWSTRRSICIPDSKEAARRRKGHPRCTIGFILCRSFLPNFCFCLWSSGLSCDGCPLFITSFTPRKTKTWIRTTPSWGFRLLPLFSFPQLLLTTKQAWTQRDLTHGEHKDNCRLSLYFQCNCKQANRHFPALLFLLFLLVTPLTSLHSSPPSLSHSFMSWSTPFITHHPFAATTVGIYPPQPFGLMLLSPFLICYMSMLEFVRVPFFFFFFFFSEAGYI